MADAPIQFVVLNSTDLAELIAAVALGRALTRLQGGTGFSVDTLAELQAELGIGAPPAAMVGASGVADGTAGIPPQPLTGDQSRALVGGALYAVQLEITKILDASGVALCDFEGLGDMLNRLYIAAASSGGQKGRIGARGTDLNIDVQVEPKNGGDATVWADPIQTSIRRACGIFAQADAAAFSAHDVAAPVVESFDTAGAPNSPVLIRDGNGPAVQVSTDDLIGSTCGFSNAAAVISRQTVPTFYWFGQSQFIDSRLWFAACASDPVNATDLVTLPNPGVALWIDQVIHTVPNKALRLITCSGAPVSVSGTGVFSIDASGRLDRNDGGDWVTQNVRVDDMLTLSGFASPGTNGQHRVVGFIPAVGTPKRRIVFDSVLTTEASPAGLVTVTHPGQVELNTGYVVTANVPFGLRLRYLPATFQWEFMAFNFTTRAWSDRAVSDGVAPVPPDALFRMFQRDRTLVNVQHKTACAAMFFRRGVYF